MNLTRRAVATLVLGASTARAQSAPPLRAVVPFPPGGSVDIVARLVQPRLAEALGQAVVIENRGGAGGMLGADLVARAAPDGTTLVFGNIATHAINPAVYDRMPYDPVTDFTPVVLLARVEFMLAVHPSVPATTVAELVTLARAQPGRFSYASAGPGSLPHLLTEAFKQAGGGLDITHVPYRGGGQLLLDLAGGTVSMGIVDVAGLLPHVRSGRLRGIAVAGDAPLALLPGLPTIAATLPGVTGTAWHGVFAPARTPAPVVARLNAAFNAALADPEVAARMRAAGTEPAGGSPADLAAFQGREIARWGAIARSVNARVE